MYDVQSIASRIKKEAKTQYKQEKKFEQEHGIVSNSQLARSSRATAARTGCILPVISALVIIGMIVAFI